MYNSTSRSQAFLLKNNLRRSRGSTLRLNNGSCRTTSFTGKNICLGKTRRISSSYNQGRAIEGMRGVRNDYTKKLKEKRPLVSSRYYTPGRISIKDIEKSGATKSAPASKSSSSTSTTASSADKTSEGGGGFGGTLFLLLLLTGGAGAAVTDSVTVVQEYIEGKRKDLNIKYTGIPISLGSMDGIDFSNPLEAIQSLFAKKETTSPPSITKVIKDKPEIHQEKAPVQVKKEPSKDKAATSDKTVVKAEISKEEKKEVTEAELVEAEKVIEETLAQAPTKSESTVSVSQPKKSTETNKTTPPPKKVLPSDVDKITYTSKEELSYKKRQSKPVSSRLLIDDEMGEKTNAAAKAQLMKNQPLLADLENLSRSELQARLVSAVNEMAEIRRYQIALVNDTIRATEREVVAAKEEEIDFIKKTADAKVAQHKALMQDELVWKLKALEDLKEEEKKELKKEFEKKEKDLDAEISAKWKINYENQITEERGKFRQEFAETLDNVRKKIHASYGEYVDKCQLDLANATEKANQIYQKLADNLDSSHVSDRIHKINLASHALEIRSQDFAIVKDEIDALVLASKGDPVLGKVMDAMISSPYFDKKKESMTLEQLRARFPQVYKAARQAAFVPSDNEWMGNGMVGHIYATIAEYVTVAPIVEEGGVVVKETLNKNDLILARAKYFINEGDILSTAKELKKLEGTASLVVSDWLNMAQSRLELEQTMKLVNARSRIINATMM